MRKWWSRLKAGMNWELFGVVVAFGLSFLIGLILFYAVYSSLQNFSEPKDVMKQSRFFLKQRELSK